MTPNTTCDIYRSGHAPPAAPDVAGVSISLQPDFASSHCAAVQASTTITRWTHLCAMPVTTDIRDGYTQTSAPGEEAANATADSIYVPNKNGTQFLVVFVARSGYGSGADFKLVYLQRLQPSWPTNNL
jgi:hypothetical protein